jgi:hypothetical protein
MFCWLVVKLGTPKTKRLDRSEGKEEARERKGRGGLSTLIPSFPFPTPQIYLGSLNFYWLKIQQNMFFLIFLFDRSSSLLRNDFACSNAPNRSVNRYDALKLFLSVLRLFLSRCGHRASPAPRAISDPTAHIIFTVLRLAPAQQERSQAVSVLSLLHIVIAGDHSQRIY